MKLKSYVWLLLVIILTNGCTTSPKTPTIKEVYTDFLNVPDSSRTKVWWFHGETETTHEGITADLEAFKTAGVGGVVYYDQVHGDAKGAFPIFSPKWWEALKFAASEAKRLGLTFEIALSNGFVAGGPWITKEMSMKRLCHSYETVEGGIYYNKVLPKPTSDEFWDIKTLAFPLPNKVEWKDTILIEKRQKFPNDTILVWDLGEKFTARSLTYSENCPVKHPVLAMNWPGEPADVFYGDGFAELPPIGTLEASNDGTNWHIVRELPPSYRIHHKVKTISFPAVEARYFRLNLHDWNREDGEFTHSLELRKATLSAQAMTDDWEDRAGINSDYIEKNETPEYAFDEVIDPKKVIDLTEKVDSNGILTWEVPNSAPKWVIMRIAQTSTRGHTKHGRPGQMGLECDKLSKEAATLHWNNFAQVILDTLEQYNLKPIGVVMDSHEMGSQNWTHGYDKEFMELQGYNLTNYLPALLGYVVESKEKSEEVLLHHRQTIAHLVNHRYLAVFDTLAMNAGVSLTAQAMGNGQSMASDNIAAKGAVRRPQGEFWGKHAHGSYDIKEVSSAAHIYGKPIASAEAFTDVKYEQTLAYFKTLADYAFAFQLNEFMVCASAYQPWLDKKPGNAPNKREYCLNRNNTQWPLSRAFWDYQARCAYMMRQGQPVVDLCIYLGSEVSNKLLAYRLPYIPEGYNWDVCTDDALLRLFSEKDGRLQTKNGISYQVLVIERLARLTEKAEAKIKELQKCGVKVYDAREKGDYGLEAFLTETAISPDASFTSPQKTDDRLCFAHRSLSDGEIYFFYNHSDSLRSWPITFRDSQGKTAEYWNPTDGQRYQLKTTNNNEGNVVVHLTLAAQEAGFMILHSNTFCPTPKRVRSFGMEEKCIPLKGKWSVDFHLPNGIKTVTMNKLTDWTQLEEDELKYHSGTAIYQKIWQTPTVTDSLQRIFLRIDGLQSVSRIWVNGKETGFIWCSPWELDITDYLQPAEQDNTLCIEVANQLTNRMIGDEALPDSLRSTFATTPIVKKGDKLLPAGITGCVNIIIR